MTVSGGGSAEKRPGTGGPPEYLFDAIGRWLEERGRFHHALGRIEEGLAVASPDVALREALEHGINRHARQPVLTGALYLDHDDEKPASPPEVRAAALDMAGRAHVALVLGAPLWIARGKDTRLLRTLVSCLLPDLDGPAVAQALAWRPLTEGELVLLVERASRFAALYRGERRENWAPAELVWRVTRVIEERCGRGSATHSWNEKDELAEGRLCDVFTELKPWIPGLENQTERGLFDWVIAAIKRGRQIA